MSKPSGYVGERYPRNGDKETHVKIGQVPAAGDAPQKKKEEPPKQKGKAKDVPPEPEEIPKTPSQIAQEEADYRAMMRKTRFKRRWPEITKVKLKTRPWRPPPRPERLPRVAIDLPELKTRRWVPPYRRRRRAVPRKFRIPPEELTQPLYECAKLKKIWHGFSQVDKNKMMLQGSIACNSKRYSSTACGSQTACIAVVCRALLEEKTPAQLVRRDVDDVIEAGDRLYKQCTLAMKCYKGKPQLALNQILSSFYLHDTRYTVKLAELERGLLAKHPDNIQKEPDLMAMMEKRVGQSYMMIMSVGARHFLAWGGAPPAEAASQCRTVCYLLDPHMLNELGQPDRLYGAGAILRYAGINSFVMDFLANYGDLDSAKKLTPKPPVVLTSIEVVQKEPLIREPTYELDLKTLKIHCRDQWINYHKNALLEKKAKEGKYILESLSAVSLATSRATTKKKVMDFYQKTPKEPGPSLPMAPEKAPPAPTLDQIMAQRGEDFFLYCTNADAHSYGRDDLVPMPKSETILHSPVDVADNNYHSQFTQLDVEKWILRGTRHMASYRYQKFKHYTAVACCVAAVGMLRRLRARAWNEDTLDETLDLGYNLFRESLLERGGPIRRLVLGEVKEKFRIRDREYTHKDRGISVWGKMISSNPKVLDLCRGLETFFKQCDTGLLQIPGEFEVGVWNEGGKYYVYHPWPADRYGYRVGLREGGRACLLYFSRVSRLCEHFLESVADLKRKPFSISDILCFAKPNMPEPINNLKAIDANRWVVRGHFHEGDARFPEEHRYKQATPTAIAAIALAHLVPPAEWTPDDVDESLIRGDILYESTMEHLEKLGISFDNPMPEEEEGEEETPPPKGTLAATDVLNRFKVSEYDCIETEILDSPYSGSLNPDSGEGMSLKDSLNHLFKEHQYAVVTARGGSMAVWKHDDSFYFFDPHGCDENGLPSDELRAAACLVRVKGSVKDLADVVEANLPPGSDDSFNLSPVAVSASKLNAELGAPETKLDNKEFQWIKKGTAAILPGPRGENTAIGKAAEKAGIGADDMAGRRLALPAAAAFAATTEAVPPPHMHNDHMYNFLEAGADYYSNFVKKTGKTELVPEDLTEKFEMGANTFSIELDEPIKLPLWLPDEPSGEGEEEGADKEEVEGEVEGEPPLKQIKEALTKTWNDSSSGRTVALLVGDYHQLGVWMAAGGKVVAFDPAPTLLKGLLTAQRIKKGDEIRLQRIKDEMSGEGGGGDEEEDEEAEGEGEEKPEPEPDFVPPESAPALMVFASPNEFIDKLVQQGGLDRKQCLAPYKLYPVRVTNELTSVLKEKKTPEKKSGDDDVEDEDAEEQLVEPLEDEALGKYFTRVSRTTASVRGRVAQNENYFMDKPNRDHQDAANAIMGIVVEHIEPYAHWKPSLVDAILKYGDRLYTLSLGRAALPPRVTATEVVPEFHVTNFNVRSEVTGGAVTGDIKAGGGGALLNLRRGLARFFAENKYGVICAKDYCAAVWKSADDKAFCYWDPHAVGPSGRCSPGGAAALVLFSTSDELADAFRDNVELLARPGNNKYCISAVKVFWEISRTPTGVSAQGAVPDEGYEWKVLTAYCETARGRTILRGSRPPDVVKFTRDALLQSAAAAVVGVCMSHVRRPALWTRRTVDDVMAVGCQLFADSLATLGYEFRPGDDVLLPLQVAKRFVLGVNYVRYDLQQVSAGRLEQTTPAEMSVRCALERFFESHTHGVLWSVPHAVGVWRVRGAPAFYMFEPHACGPTGLRADAQDDGAACVLTFTSPKLMAFAYLQNIPVVERPRHEFQLYALAATVAPIRRLGGVEPPLLRAPPAGLVPATSKVAIDGRKRRASERDRKHPPGSATCLDAHRAAEEANKEQAKLKGQRNTSGWLVLADGSQFLSAAHSIACRKFPHASRGNQALACSIMAVAMSRVEDVCRWCSSTLDQILESGDQLYQDSYLHYRPKETKILAIDQILRKFYTPGNCVCRVVIYQPRQAGRLDADLQPQLEQFFKQEKSGVLVAGKGDFAVALFRTPRGYYMFDPLDRDRYGRAVAPPCTGRARACFSQYPNVQSLVDKLRANVPPSAGDQDTLVGSENLGSGSNEKRLADPALCSLHALGSSSSKVKFDEAAGFSIYGMEVSGLRRLNEHEK